MCELELFPALAGFPRNDIDAFILVFAQQLGGCALHRSPEVCDKPRVKGEDGKAQQEE